MACYWHQWQSNLSFRVKAKWTPLKIHSTFMVKNLPANAGDVRDKGSISGLGRSPGGGHGNPCSILAWKRPWSEEPGRLQSIGSHRVGQEWSDLACTHASIEPEMEKSEIIYHSKREEKCIIRVAISLCWEKMGSLPAPTRKLTWSWGSAKAWEN